MLIVGLTGGIGAGKSTVADLLARHGAHVIDVDAIGREILEANPNVASQIVEEFGPEVVGTDGAIDRRSLARIVFSDAQALSRLTAISHPAINDALVERLKACSQDAVVLLDMAILAESNLGQVAEPYRYTFVITVEAPSAVREDRAVSRGSDREDVRRRMALQASSEQRRALADVVIDNDGDPSELGQQIDALWKRLISIGGDERP